MANTKTLLTKKALDETEEYELRHPLNANTHVFLRRLGDPTGLTHIGAMLVRVPPKTESFPYHCHYSEDEMVYVISGRGVLESGDKTYEIGPGDFMGFPAGPTAHQIRNPHDEELVYFTAGERKSVEIADFPKHGKRLTRIGGESKTIDFDQLKPLFKLD